jgi:hypothetical protein
LRTQYHAILNYFSFQAVIFHQMYRKLSSRKREYCNYKVHK